MKNSSEILCNLKEIVRIMDANLAQGCRDDDTLNLCYSLIDLSDSMLDSCFHELGDYEFEEAKRNG